MRIVLFDDETMEALTVLHLQSWMVSRLVAHHPMVLPITKPMKFDADYSGDISRPTPNNERVTVWFEKFVRNGNAHWFCFTRDSENALQLKSVFLPGQWPAVHEEYKRGVSEGIVNALKTVLR